MLVGSCGKKIIIILHDGHHFTWTKIIMVIINDYKINQLDLDWRDGEGRGAEEIARISGSSRVVALIRFTIGMMVMVMVKVMVMVMVMVMTILMVIVMVIISSLF